MDVAAWFSVLVLLLGTSGASEQSSGYCIGNTCFTLFRDPRTFASAQSHCRNQKGHLMTVRSSVSSDVLSVLLANLTGRFWIGLQRPSGCPDPAQRLRGFWWVTEDSESDFSGWTPEANVTCASERCVSVSGAQKFMWSPTPCGQRAAGFLCESGFTQPCASLPRAPGHSVLYLTPYGFPLEDVQASALPPASVATIFPSGIKHICSKERWLQAPWSCDIKAGGCEHGCTVDAGNAPVCHCPAGLAVDPHNGIMCVLAGTDDPCARGQRLAADGRSCEDVDECADRRRCPAENFSCVNTPRGYKCVCKKGYKLVGGACVDADECALAPCEQACTNTRGSYVCSCYDGYVVDDKDPSRCRQHCGEEECDPVCDPNNSLQCVCPAGYVLNEDVCVDVDECDSNYCDQGCRNTFGSYVCSCYPGYRLADEYNCVEATSGSPEGVPTSAALPEPGPTRRASGVTAGGLVAIVCGTVLAVVLAVFAAHLLLMRRRGEESAAGELKGAEGEESEEGESRGLRRLSENCRDKVV